MPDSPARPPSALRLFARALVVILLIGGAAVMLWDAIANQGTPVFCGLLLLMEFKSAFDLICANHSTDFRDVFYTVPATMVAGLAGYGAFRTGSILLRRDLARFFGPRQNNHASNIPASSPPLDEMDYAEVNRLLEFKDQGILNPAQTTKLEHLLQRIADQALWRLERQVDAAGTPPDLAARQAQQTAVAETSAAENTDELRALARIADGDITGGLDLLTVVAEDSSRDAAAVWRRIGELTYGIDTQRARTAYKKVVALGDARPWDRIFLIRLLVQSGDLAAARQHAEDLLATATALSDRNRCVAYNAIGDIQQAQGDLAVALDSYRAGLEISQRLAASDPSNTGWQHDLTVSYNKIGDGQRAQGDLAAALDSYRAGLEIFQRLAASDPSNTDWQRDLSVSYNKIGDGQRAQGDLAAALDSYRADLAIAERLAASDPSNTGWQRDLSVSYENIGNIQQAQGDLAAALDSYRAGLEIRQRLAASDPSNTGWQRDLSASHSRIGNIQQAQGDLAAALDSYRAGLAIAERLAASDPSNTVWQRDLSVSYNKIGNIQRARGDLAAALDSYRADLAIAERLAASDPSNTVWQRDLSVSYNKIGNIQRARGDLAAALDSYRAGLAIAERLAASDPSNTVWQRDLSVSYENIGNIQQAQGDLAAALDSYRAGLEIRQRLAASDPSNADWQRDLWVSLWKLADLPGGGVTWRAVAARLEAMDARGILRPSDRHALAEAHRRAAAE